MSLLLVHLDGLFLILEKGGGRVPFHSVFEIRFREHEFLTLLWLVRMRGGRPIRRLRFTGKNLLSFQRHLFDLFIREFDALVPIGGLRQRVRKSLIYIFGITGIIVFDSSAVFGVRKILIIHIFLLNDVLRLYD